MGRAAVERTDVASAGQNAGYYNEAQNSYTKSQNDINDYESQLAQYKAANPYGQGGQFQTATNQQVANTSDAGAQAAGAYLQGEAQRTGQNTAGGVAATEHMQQQGTRDVTGEEAKATQERLGAGAQYGKSVLGATEAPASFEAQTADYMGKNAGQALDVMAKSAAITDPAANIWNKAAADMATNAVNDEANANI